MIEHGYIYILMRCFIISFFILKFCRDCFENFIDAVGFRKFSRCRNSLVIPQKIDLIFCDLNFFLTKLFFCSTNYEKKNLQITIFFENFALMHPSATKFSVAWFF